MQKESTKSGMGCFFSTNFLVLTAHPQQRNSNTGSKISLPGSPDSLTRQKGIWTGSLETAASTSVCISQAHRERNCSAWYSCRIPGIHEYCKNQIWVQKNQQEKTARESKKTKHTRESTNKRGKIKQYNLIICKQEFQKKKNKEIIEKLEETAPD